MTLVLPVRAVGAGALALTLALGLSACGADEPAAPSSAAGSASTSASPTTPKEDDKPNAKELFNAAKESALAAKSGRLTGTVIEDGEPLKIDLAGTVDGTNQELALSTPEGVATILTVDGETWMSADQKFWEAQGADAATAKQMVGKFTPIGAEEAADLKDLTLGGLLTVMFEDTGINALQSLVIDVSPATVGETKAWSIGDGTDGQVFFSAETNDLLRLVSAASGDLTFSEWNAVKPFTAPATKDILTP